MESLHIGSAELIELFTIMDLDGSGELESDEFISGMMVMMKSVDAKDILTMTGRLNSMQTKLGKQATMLKNQESLIHDVEIVLASATEAIQRVNGVLPLRLSTPVAGAQVPVKAPGGQQV